MKLFSLNKAKPLALADTEIIGFEHSLEELGLCTKQKNKIVSALQEYYLSGGSPFVSASIRYQGKTLLHRSYGYAVHPTVPEHRHKPALRADLETPACLFSASKLITAMILHKLSELGLLNLDEKISYYLPEYGVNGKENLTINDLLSHRAGFPSIPKEHSDIELLFQPEKVYEILCQEPLQYTPRQYQAYHAITSGFIFAELVKRVTGNDLSENLQQYFSKPMNLPYFDYGLAPEFQPKVALQASTGLHPILGSDIYLNRLLGASLQEVTSATNDPRFMNVICPSANIFTSANQLGQFMEMLVAGGVHTTATGEKIQILKKSTILNAISPQSESFDMALLMPTRFGKGPMLGANPAFVFGPMSQHTFGHLGFTNILGFADPKRDMSVAFLNTGKALVGTHMPAFIKFITALQFDVPTVPPAKRRLVT